MSELICIVCPNGCRLTATVKDGKVSVIGNKCKKGITFAEEELTAPKRSVTGTVRTVFKEFPVAPVRTDGEIPKDKVLALAALLGKIKIDAPLSRGDTVIEDILGTGVKLILTSDIKSKLTEE
ncbi:MAG: DUF1667 domain-containing protein [Clostridia bacterium]